MDKSSLTSRAGAFGPLGSSARPGLLRYLDDPRVIRVVVAGWILVLTLAALALHHRVAGTRPGREDTYFAWLDGERLAHVSNPYERVLASDMRTNNSYATYFPTYYLLTATTYRFGVTDYMDWLKLWRPVCEVSHLGIAVFLLLLCARAGSWPLGLWASGFWFFNRWTVAVVNMAHLDTLALGLMLLAIYFRKKERASGLLLGASIGVKQMAIFFIPVWVIASYFEGDSRDRSTRLRQAGRTLAWTALIPTILAGPFLVWNARGFVKSILFSATRDAASDFPAKSIDAALGLSGLLAKLPMFGLMGLVYVAVAMAPRRIGLYSGALLIMSTFLDFNSVLFMQYMVWTVPLIPLAVLESGLFSAARVEAPERAPSVPAAVLVGTLEGESAR